MIKIIDSVDINLIKKELHSLSKETICLQGIDWKQDPSYGTGAVKNFTHSPDKKMRDQEKEFIFPLFHLPYTNFIIEKFNMFRSRIMVQDSKTCYTYHQDFTPRIHIPLVTNENCFFILEDSLHRLKGDGSVYWVDTVQRHTAVNASLKTRIHLVGCVNA